jgi:hypothetical protein
MHWETKKDCVTRFIAVIWNRTRNITEVCLWSEPSELRCCNLVAKVVIIEKGGILYRFMLVAMNARHLHSVT